MGRWRKDGEDKHLDVKTKLRVSRGRLVAIARMQKDHMEYKCMTCEVFSGEKVIGKNTFWKNEEDEKDGECYPEKKEDEEEKKDDDKKDEDKKEDDKKEEDKKEDDKKENDKKEDDKKEDDKKEEDKKEDDKKDDDKKDDDKKEDDKKED